MSQTVRIDRKLEIAGFGNNAQNVKGNLNPEKVFVDYHFTEKALDETNKYTVFIDTTGAVALASGGITLTTAATDALVTSYAMGGIWWYPAKNPVVEFRFKIDVITNVAIYAGFTDATTETSGLLPHAIVTAAQTATATNSAGFLFDTAQSLSYFNRVSSITGPTKAFTQLASTRVPVAATNLTLRVAIDTDGGARYYWNGIEVGYKALATSTTVPLVPYFGIRNRTATAHVATLRYCRLWCDS